MASNTNDGFLAIVLADVLIILIAVFWPSPETPRIESHLHQRFPYAEIGQMGGGKYLVHDHKTGCDFTAWLGKNDSLMVESVGTCLTE